jgi:hypothetical protein
MHGFCILLDIPHLKVLNMKKILFFLMICFAVSTVSLAQDDNKDKTKKTSTIPQKAHNTVSKHKHYSGTRTKHKSGDQKVKENNGDTKVK